MSWSGSQLRLNLRRSGTKAHEEHVSETMGLFGQNRNAFCETRRDELSGCTLLKHLIPDQ